MSDELIQEVDDSLRQEKYQKLWDEYGAYIIAGCVLAILFTALINGWQSWNSKMNQNNTALIMEALNSENQVEVLQGISDNVRPNHRTIALMRAAGLLAENGKIAQALTNYHSVAVDLAAPEGMRSLAQLMAVRLEWSLLQDGKESSMSPQEMIESLKLLWRKPGQLWSGHARVQAALITAYSLNDFEAAISYLDVVNNTPDIPSSLKERANALKHVFTLESRGPGTENNQAADSVIDEGPTG